MARFVPKEKLSKKARKELNRQRRTMWDFSPVTKTVDSRKLYNRKRNARDRYDDYGGGVFLWEPTVSHMLQPPKCAPTNFSFGNVSRTFTIRFGLEQSKRWLPVCTRTGRPAASQSSKMRLLIRVRRENEARRWKPVADNDKMPADSLPNRRAIGKIKPDEVRITPNPGPWRFGRSLRICSLL